MIQREEEHRDSEINGRMCKAIEIRKTAPKHSTTKENKYKKQHQSRTHMQWATKRNDWEELTTAKKKHQRHTQPRPISMLCVLFLTNNYCQWWKTTHLALFHSPLCTTSTINIRDEQANTPKKKTYENNHNNRPKKMLIKSTKLAMWWPGDPFISNFCWH